MSISLTGISLNTDELGLYALLPELQGVCLLSSSSLLGRIRLGEPLRIRCTRADIDTGENGTGCYSTVSMVAVMALPLAFRMDVGKSRRQGLLRPPSPLLGLQDRVGHEGAIFSGVSHRLKQSSHRIEC